mmetsp:Transcript_38861/g.89931  ORF Transcript_38861/g.89931 Transcript_38861/m.89931 type:complete len:563 (+) Transcript_38861:83-1771(+)
MSLAVQGGAAGSGKSGLRRLGFLRTPPGHFLPQNHLNELARMLDSTSSVSGFKVRRVGINDSVWLVTCPANPEGWMIKRVPAHRRYSGVPTDVENCDALIRKFPGLLDDRRLAFPHSMVEIHQAQGHQDCAHVANLLVSRRAPGDQLGVYLAELDLSKKSDQAALEEVCAGVGEMLADFHARYADPNTGEATYHTDFHPSNVLYEKKTGTLSIVDLTGMGSPGTCDDVEKFERLIGSMAGERYASAFRLRYAAMAKTNLCGSGRSSSKSTVASSTDALWNAPADQPARATSFRGLSALAVPEAGFDPEKNLTTLAYLLSPSRKTELKMHLLSQRPKAWLVCQGGIKECWVVQQATGLLAERCEEFVQMCPEVLTDANLAFPHSMIPLQANLKQVGSLLVANSACSTTLEQYAASLDWTTRKEEDQLHAVLFKVGEALSQVLARYSAGEASSHCYLRLRPSNVLYDPSTELVTFADFAWPGDVNTVSAVDRLSEFVKSLAGMTAAEEFRRGYAAAQRSRHKISVSESLLRYSGALCERAEPGSEASSASESDDEQERGACSLM